MDARRGLCLGLLVAGLALPQAAQAAVRCVPASVSGCTTAHATITAAVTAASNDDTIQIAAGSYAEAISTTKRLNFVGAGAGTLDSATGATVVAPASGIAFNLTRGGSLRALRAVGSTGFSGSGAISMQPDVDGSFSYTLTDVIGIGGDGTDFTFGFGGSGLAASSSNAARIVTLSVTGGAFRAGTSAGIFQANAVALGAGSAAGLTATMTNSSVVGSVSGAFGGGVGLTVSGGTAFSGSGLSVSGYSAAEVSDSSLTLQRSRLEGLIRALTVRDFTAATPTTVTVADSLVTATPTAATSAAAVLASTSVGASAATVNLRGSTVIARGVDPQYAVFSQPASGAPAATINLHNTIARLEGPAEADEADLAADRGTVSAAYSDFATRLQLNGGTVTEPGTATNLTADPLFNSGAFTLQAGSPLADRGDPSVVTAGELDLAGNPRSADFNADGVAAPDIGAYELPGATAPPPPPPANVAPSLTKVSMTNSVFAPVGAQAAARRSRKPVKRGTTFRYQLSEAATVTIVIERRARGRKVGSRCVKPTKRNARKRSCNRWVRVGSLRAAEQAGQQSMAFSGRIGKRALAPGRYRARVTAKDALGARSTERRLAFRVVRAR